MKKEVLIVSQEFPPGPGGIGSHAYSMAKAFHEKGIDVTIISTADYVTVQQVNDFDLKQPFPIIRYDRTKSFHYLRRISTISRHLKRNVILSGTYTIWMAFWIKVFHPSINIISVLHGSEVRPANKLLSFMAHLAIKAANKVVAVSAFTRGLIPAWTVKSKEVVVIPNGINPGDFFMPEKSLQLKGSPALLTVGHVTPRKGQHRVIKAMPEILKKYPDAHYHVVGLPTYKDKFLPLATELGVDGAVTFHGKVEKFSQLFDFYKASDIFIILSENQKDGDCEGFGIVVLEAGWFGVPTIGATGNGIADAVKDGYNGCLVDGDDAKAVCDSIERIASDKEFYGRNAREWALQHDWGIIINDFIKLLQ